MATGQEDFRHELKRYLDARICESAAWQNFVARSDERSPHDTAHTPREILQQPWVWGEGITQVVGGMAALSDLILDASDICLTGAGSSFYVGKTLQSLLIECLGKPVTVAPTTELILSPETCLRAGSPGLLISFSRSGRSPESIEALRVTQERFPTYSHLLITCDGSSELWARYREADAQAVALHPASCDKGLAMTNSFTSMVIAGQAMAFLPDLEAYATHVRQLAAIGEEALESVAALVNQLDTAEIRRVCLLGDGALGGAAVEGALKIMEMTDGGICTLADSFLGVRHGPLSFVDSHTLVIYMVSSDPVKRRYEIDLVRELHDKDLGRYHVAVGQDLGAIGADCGAAIELPSPGSWPLADDFRPPLDVILPQVLALRLCLDRGLEPDNPSRRGAISRVVQGVTIHNS
jgi:tagatose-6-phosphate ketose/aldose isomerase